MFKLRFAFLLGLFFLLAACVPDESGGDLVVVETARTTATAAPPTALPLPTQTADEPAIDALNGSPTAAATAVDDGRPEADRGAGSGDYGVRFEYDSFLGDDVQARIVDAFSDDEGMNYL